MSMKLRLRHPNGVSTIQLPQDGTIQQLQQTIFESTNIPPDLQVIKTGYPPQSVVIVPELPISSLGLRENEQVIVSGASSTSKSNAGPNPTSSTANTSLQANIEPSSALKPQRTPPSTSSGPENVRTDGGFLVHRVVPDDNSCLFSSVALVFEQTIANAQSIRQIVADGISADPEKFNEAILGMPPAKYTATILRPSTWGGAIELTVLASHYNTVISSVDVETGRVDHFTPSLPSSMAATRCILIYSGIHYDAATLAPEVGAPDEWHQTVFPLLHAPDSNDDAIVKAAQALASKLREKKAFTNTSTFDLKCEECGKGLKGEKEARAHAESTGHVRFGEY